MARIYISSTYADLKAHRDAVYRQLTKLAGHQVVAMEDYVASDERPLAKCLADVRSCDVYIGIFAWRYGFVPKTDNPADNPGGKSITELEYRHAQQQGKACLLFLLDENAQWNLSFADWKTKENDAGARIEALRKELTDAHLASFFDSPEKLAGLVSAAVQNWEKKHAPAAAPAAASAAAQPLIRELRNSVLLAHAPADGALARGHADLLGAWLEKPLLLSPSVLYAGDEAGFVALEGAATGCAAALVLLTPATLAALQESDARTRRALDVLRARTGAVAGLCCGVAPASVPPGWALAPLSELPAAAPDPTTAPAPELVALRQWLERVLPPWGTRTVGLPVCVLCMTAAECQALKDDPALVGDRLGNQVQKQFEAIVQGLDAAQIPWRDRYAQARDCWQPFGPGDASIGAIVEDIAREINERKVVKLRQRRIKVQWYPFDAVKAQHCDGDVSLRRVYKEVAQAGCVLLVDELSLFHPDLNEAFRSSQLSNNEQVAMVTLSPFDPHRRSFDQLLEAEARRQLAGAFDRYASDYDPQCELAVADPRRLKRWLHASLPETVTNLREPRPDREALRAFFDEQLGADRRPRGGDYPWAGGAQS